MDFNIGIDILENERINKKNKKYIIDNLLSPKEQTALKSKRNSNDFLCGRWAAKEAIYKALNPKSINYQEITILNDETGKPIVHFQDYVIKLSISHEKNYTCAVAIVKIK